MSNKINLPLIFVGTEEAERVLEKDFAIIRRCSSAGNLKMKRLTQDNNSWDLFLKAMWDYQYTLDKCPFTPEMSDALYNESQGIISLAVRLFILAQFEAIWGEGVISPQRIRQAGETLPVRIRAYLEALRREWGDKITPPDLDLPPVGSGGLASRPAWAGSVCSCRQGWREKENEGWP